MVGHDDARAAPAHAGTRRTKLEFVGVLLLILAPLIVIAASVDSNEVLSLLVDATDQRALARDRLIASERVLSALKDVETGQRGFLITGDSRYLEPYESGTAALQAEYGNLRHLLVDHTHGALRLDTLDQLVQQRQAFATQRIALRRERGAMVLAESHLLDEGKHTMDAIRAWFQTLTTEEQAEIIALNTRVSALQSKSLRVARTSTVLTTLLIIAGVWLLLVERRRRVKLQQALIQMNEGLEQTVAQRTSDLTHAKNEIRNFATNMTYKLEDERKHIAREVRDRMGQIFTGIKLFLRGIPLSALPADQKSKLSSMIDDGIDAARRISAELRPPMLDDFGLGAAILHYAQAAVGKASMQLDCKVENDTHLTEVQQVQLFRIVQEAVVNVRRHAQARRLSISGQRENGRYVLRVEDDGQGFDPHHVRAGALGLVGMRERTAMAGGSLSVGTSELGGTRVEVLVSPAEAAT